MQDNNHFENNNHSKKQKHSENFSRDEFIRLVIQSLHEFGLNQSCELLEKESGILLQSPAISEFSCGALDGNWDLVEKRIPDLKIVDEEAINNAKFLIYQQKFLELLEDRKTKQALDCLRNDITPLNRDPSKLHKLSSFIMYSSPEELRLKSNWDGAKGNSRKKLLKDLKEFVSPQILLPDNRLLNLVSQAIQYQKNNCLFHNTLEEHVSLFQDHSCTSKQIPTVTKNILEKHTDEVWYIKFSYNGKYLASASKDNTIILWDVLSPVYYLIQFLVNILGCKSY